MNGHLMRKMLSYSKEVALLDAACAWEDAVYNLTRPLKTMQVRVSAALIADPHLPPVPRHGTPWISWMHAGRAAHVILSALNPTRRAALAAVH